MVNEWQDFGVKLFDRNAHKSLLPIQKDHWSVAYVLDSTSSLILFTGMKHCVSDCCPAGRRPTASDCAEFPFDNWSYHSTSSNRVAIYLA